MDLQTMINAMLGLIAFLGGWVINSFKIEIKENQKISKEISDRLNQIEILVAGKYITREEFDKKFDAMFRKLDTIEIEIKSCRFDNHAHKYGEKD